MGSFWLFFGFCLGPEIFRIKFKLLPERKERARTRALSLEARPSAHTESVQAAPMGARLADLGVWNWSFPEETDSQSYRKIVCCFGLHGDASVERAISAGAHPDERAKVAKIAVKESGPSCDRFENNTSD